MKKIITFIAVSLVLVFNASLFPMKKDEKKAAEKFNFYEQLNIQNNASPQEINEAYKNLMNEAMANRKKIIAQKRRVGFNQLINKLKTAYRVLSNKEKRKEYDKNLKIDITKKEAWHYKPQEVIKYANILLNNQDANTKLKKLGQEKIIQKLKSLVNKIENHKPFMLDDVEELEKMIDAWAEYVKPQDELKRIQEKLYDLISQEWITRAMELTKKK